MLKNAQRLSFDRLMEIVQRPQDALNGVNGEDLLVSLITTAAPMFLDLVKVNFLVPKVTFLSLTTLRAIMKSNVRGCPDEELRFDVDEFLDRVEAATAKNESVVMNFKEGLGAAITVLWIMRHASTYDGQHGGFIVETLRKLYDQLSNTVECHQVEFSDNKPTVN